MNRHRLLDLFSGAGGAGMGYHRAGFEVVGVDINPQPRYPFEFHQADAFEFAMDNWNDFDVFHASPPCQAYAKTGGLRTGKYPELIVPIRELFMGFRKPWIIENVPGAPLHNPVLLCGTMFGLKIKKHRYFETSFEIRAFPPMCNHQNIYDPWNGSGRTADKFREAQGTPWIPCNGGASRKAGVTGDLSNAIPPAYTEWIGRQLLSILNLPLISGLYD